MGLNVIKKKIQKNAFTNKKKKKNISKVKFDVNDLTVFKKNPSTSKFNLHHLYNFMDLLIQQNPRQIVKIKM